MRYKKIILLNEETGLEKTSSRFGIPLGSRIHSWQIKIEAPEGEPKTFTASLQGIINGVDWYNIDTFTMTEGKESGETRFIEDVVVDTIRATYTMTKNNPDSIIKVSIYYIGAI